MVTLTNCIMVSDEYNSRIFKSFKKYKEYKQKLVEENRNKSTNILIEEKYFTCLHCNKINLISEVVNEESENRTLRAKYSTWKKLKDIASDKGGHLENGLLYLILLHEDKESHGGQSEYDVPIAANFGAGGDKK